MDPIYKEIAKEFKKRKEMKLLLIGKPATCFYVAKKIAHGLNSDILKVNLPKFLERNPDLEEKGLEKIFQTIQNSKSIVMFEHASMLFSQNDTKTIPSKILKKIDALKIPSVFTIPNANKANVKELNRFDFVVRLSEKKDQGGGKSVIDCEMWEKKDMKLEGVPTSSLR